LCPDNEYRNRLWFDSRYKVPYGDQDTYDYSARMQFQSMYRQHLKSIIDDYDDNKFKWANNTYIDKNRKKFDIVVKGLDT
jgi:N-methylhydantoinase B/oxoprolinase/acetone carboxylase alpha subunit